MAIFTHIFSILFIQPQKLENVPLALQSASSKFCTQRVSTQG